MEQKQLDDIEESFFGEEFIEEDFEDKKSKNKEVHENDEEYVNYRKEKAEAKKAKKAAITKKVDNSVEEKEEIKITPVKESSKENVPIETSSPVNPWKEEKDNSGFFDNADVWKIITLIAVIALLISVFTQGFGYKMPVNGEISLGQAEEKMLNYVNTEMLQAPFEAEVKNSKDLGNLYQFTLGIAGQDVDSYVSKDGKLFFPRGFSMDMNNSFDSVSPSLNQTEEEILDKNIDVTENETVLENNDNDLEVNNNISTNESNTQPIVIEENDTSASLAETTNVTTITQIITLKSKKWSFTPEQISIKKGETIQLKIIPDNSDATFALNEYIFAIPDLNIEQKITKETILDLNPEKVGTFTFKCSDCESWRGMSGQLIVE